MVLNFGLVLNVFVPQSEYLVEKSVLTCFIENKSVCSFTLQYNLFGFKKQYCFLDVKINYVLLDKTVTLEICLFFSYQGFSCDFVYV